MIKRNNGWMAWRMVMVMSLAATIQTAGLSQTSSAPNTPKQAAGTQAATNPKALADQQFDSGVYNLALPEYLKIYPDYRDSFEVNQRIGWLYLHQIPPNERAALPYLRKAHQLEPKDPVVLQDLIRATVATQSYSEAIPLYKEWLATAPARAPEPWLEYARVLKWSGHANESIDAYRKYVSLSPKGVLGRVELAQLLAQQKDFQGASEQYDLALKESPHNIAARIGRAQVLGWTGKVAASLDELNDVLKDAPHNFEARLAKAYDLLWLNQPEAAQGLFRELQKEKPDNADVSRGLEQVVSTVAAAKEAAKKKAEHKNLVLAEQSEAAGKYDEAISYYKAYLAEHPGNADAQFSLARVLGWDQRYADSENMLHEWISKHPERPEGYLQLARVYNWDRELQPSADDYRHYLELKPGDTGARLELAQVLLSMQDYPGAAQEFKTVSAAQPENSNALEGLARTEILSDDFSAAKQTIASLQAQSPASDAVPRLEKELEAAQLRKAQELGPASPEADAMLQKLVAADPTDVQARLALVNSDASRKDYASAIKSLREGIAVSPKNDALRMELAEVLSWDQQYSQSVDEYRHLVAEHPDNTQLRLQLARVLGWEKKYPDSLAEYGKLLQQEPKDQSVRLEEARVFIWSKQYGRAAQDLHTILQQQPNNFDALLELGRVYAYDSDWPRSLAALDTALKIKPGDYDARLAKAETLVWSGEGQSAEPILAQLRTERPNDVGTIVALASAQNSTGRPDRALQLLDHAKTLAPNNPDVQALHSAIEAPLRPELSLGWSYLHDNESLSVWRYELDARFNLTPRLRNFVTVDVLPTSARADIFGYPVSGSSGLVYSPRVPSGSVPGPGVLSASDFPSGILVPGNVRISQNAVQFLAGGSMKLNSWFSWTAGAGVIELRHGAPDDASQGFASTDSHFIYRASPAFQINKGLRLELTASRQYWAYTPRTISERIHADDFSAAVAYTPTSRSRIELTGFHRIIRPGFLVPTVGNFTGRDFKMHGNGGTATATYMAFKGETAQFTIGYDGTVFGYNHPSGLPSPTYFVNPGAFTPSFYQRHAGLARLDLHPSSLVDLNFHGTLGPQQIQQGSGYSFSATAGSRVDLHISPKTTLSLTYDYFDTASAFLVVPVRPSQAYHSNNFGATLHFKF
jgi:predicted Zn-dependent protease